MNSSAEVGQEPSLADRGRYVDHAIAARGDFVRRSQRQSALEELNAEAQ
jgi:hypothetical protein